MTGGQTSQQPDGSIQLKGIGIDPEHLKVIIPLKKNHEKMPDHPPGTTASSSFCYYQPERVYSNSYPKKKRTKILIQIV
jgi:hypothetical protein